MSDPLFVREAFIECYQFKQANFTSIYALYARFHVTRHIVK